MFGSEHHQHHCLNHHHHIHHYRFLLVAEIAYTAIALCGPVELVDLLDVESGTQEVFKWTRKHLFCQKQSKGIIVIIISVMFIKSQFHHHH